MLNICVGTGKGAGAGDTATIPAPQHCLQNMAVFLENTVVCGRISINILFLLILKGLALTTKHFYHTELALANIDKNSCTYT
jgi:hypothetical protein